MCKSKSNDLIRLLQPKRYTVKINNPSTPSELLWSSLFEYVEADFIQKVADRYTGNDVLESVENGLEYKRYGRIVFEQIPDTDES